VRRRKPRVVLADEASRIVEAEHRFRERIQVEGMFMLKSRRRMRKKPPARKPPGAQGNLPPEAVPVGRRGGGPFRLEGGTAGCLLIHGLTGTPDEMRYLGERLHQYTGFTISGVVLAGHGPDASALRERGWQDWYGSAEQGMVELSETCSPLFIVGFSTGALLAMALALRHGGKVRALALLATPLFANRHKACLAGILYGLPGFRAWLRHRSREAAWEAPALRKNLEPVLMNLAQLKWIMRRKGACVTHPTLILQSRQDPSVPWENALALSSLISSTRKRRILFTRSRHVLPLDVERDQVADEIGGFFLSCQSLVPGLSPEISG